MIKMIQEQFLKLNHKNHTQSVSSAFYNFQDINS